MTSDPRTRLEQQLIDLTTVERPRLLSQMTTIDGRDPADQADRVAWELELAHLHGRIARLRERLAAPHNDPMPRFADTPAPGSTLVLDFGDGPETYRFADIDIDEGVAVVTPGSPLGQALTGAHTGQTITYPTPRGQANVALVSVAA